MTSQEGGDAGVPSSEERRPPDGTQFSAVGSGEVTVLIAEDARKEKDSGDERGDRVTGGEAQPSTGSSGRSLLAHAFVTPFSKTRRIGRKLLSASASSRRKRNGGGTTGLSGRGWCSRVYDGFLFNPSSDVTFTLLAFLVFSIVVFMVCVATSRAVLERCNWADGFRFHRHHRHGAIPPSLTINPQSGIGQGKEKCIARRYIPRRHFAFMEIIHDLKSQWSVLVEWRQDLRCILFDMRRYSSAAQASSSCPVHYPTSLDERMGVPGHASELSLTYPRRFARHHYRHLPFDRRSEVLSEAGPAILTRCDMALVYEAVLVDARIETSRCERILQPMLNELLAASDPSYKPGLGLALDPEWNPKLRSFIMYQMLPPLARTAGSMDRPISSSEREEESHGLGSIDLSNDMIMPPSEAGFMKLNQEMATASTEDLEDLDAENSGSSAPPKAKEITGQQSTHSAVEAKTSLAPKTGHAAVEQESLETRREQIPNLMKGRDKEGSFMQPGVVREDENDRDKQDHERKAIQNTRVGDDEPNDAVKSVPIARHVEKKHGNAQAAAEKMGPSSNGSFHGETAMSPRHGANFTAEVWAGETGKDHGDVSSQREAVDHGRGERDEADTLGAQQSEVLTSAVQLAQRVKHSGLADLLSMYGPSVKSETRRYILWHGRIMRVCRLRGMPVIWWRDQSGVTRQFVK